VLLADSQEKCGKIIQGTLDFAFFQIKVIIIKLMFNHIWQPRHQDVQPDHQGKAASRQEKPLSWTAALPREE